MRTHPPLLPFIAFLAAASLVACLATELVAQEKTKQSTAAAKGEPTATKPVSIYDLEINGGLLLWTGNARNDGQVQLQASLQNVVDLLRELHPEANFALSPSLAEIVIGDLKMRTSTVEEKLEAIRLASGSDFTWRNTQQGSIDPQTGLPVTPGAGAKPGPPLYLLEASAAATKPRLQVEAFNIGTYLNSFSTTSGKGTDEQVRGRLSEIERLTLETVKEYETISRTMSPTAKPLHSPSIRFHPGANLMIVIGEPEVVAVAGKVIGALPGARRSAGSDAPASGDGDPSQRIDEMIKKMQREGALRPPRP
jgi:hypothetical protein